ncbi:MAG: DsbC family protein [Zetaproteobacteria bacterium]|nr:MAG: DsbC family protein [Zetaproteobacteria bacterium]
MKRVGWSVMPVVLLLVLLAPAPAPIAAAAPAGEKADVPEKSVELLRKNIRGLRIDAVHRAPIAGLYEVISGRNIYYADATGAHLIVGGHIFDTSNRRDLTAARLQEINRIDFHQLPLELAVVSGDPDGVPLAVFTDPDCPFCRRLERELQGMHGIKVYHFLFPLTRIHKHAEAHARAIWCARDRYKAMVEIMLHDRDLPAGSCKTPIARLRALGTRIGVTGTPTLIAGDGRMFAGLKTARELKRWLAR